MPITPTQANTHISTDWANLLLPGLRSVFFKEYNEMPSQYDKIFKVKDSTHSIEKELGMGALTPWVERVNETDNVTYQKISEGLLRTYTHKEFASGFAIGKRLYEDEMYNIINQLPADLAVAGRSKVETDAATVFNGAFDASNYPIYDGLSLISATHRYVGEGVGAGTGDNLITGDLSDISLKAAITKMRSVRDDGGKKIIMTPDTLIVAPANEFLALELIKSVYKPGTSDNDINSLAGKLKIQVYDYLTDDDAFFVMDSKRHKLQFFWRIKAEFGKSNDSDNFVAKYNGRMRYSYGASDWRGIVGSAGI